MNTHPLRLRIAALAAGVLFLAGCASSHGRKHFVPVPTPGTVWQVYGFDSTRLLLSYHKVTASSTLVGHEPALAVDGDMDTWWSAKTGDAGEWLQVDLGGIKLIKTVTVDFDPEGAKAFPVPAPGNEYGYVLETSEDGKTWRAIANRSTVLTDSTTLDEPVRARHIRITNSRSPAGAKFAIYRLVVSGRGMGNPPRAVGSVKATRDSADPTHVLVEWSAAAGADTYVVYFGLTPDKLNAIYQVHQATQLGSRETDPDRSLWLRVDAVNENGVTPGMASQVITP